MDWSTVGKGEGKEGRNAKLLLAALNHVLQAQPRIYIHENVPQFQTNIIRAVLGALAFPAPDIFERPWHA